LSNARVFRDELKRAGKDVQAELDKRTTEVVIVGLTAAVLTSPVDEGVFRENWLVSVGSPSGEVNPEKSSSAGAGSPPSSAQLRDAKIVMKGRKRGASAFIENNVEYGIYLDEGSSAQAPAGITPAALDAMEKAAGALA
jgi:hypothetical protein